MSKHVAHPYLYKPGIMFFISLASGSSGNSCYIGNERYGILIDAGVGARTIKKRLKDEGIPLEAVRAVLLTHDHFDHVKGVYSLAERYHIPVYATQGIYDGMDRNIKLNEKLSLFSRKVIQKNLVWSIENFQIKAFEIPHDSADCVGYYIEIGNIRFLLATDIGSVTPELEAYLSMANQIVLESNYDKNMLLTGRYPYYLKERILGQKGHLSNEEAAACLARNYHPEIKNVWLCHLSRENNTPDLALDAFNYSLKKNGIVMGEDLVVEVLKRTSSTGRRSLLI